LQIGANSTVVEISPSVDERYFAERPRQAAGEVTLVDEIAISPAQDGLHEPRELKLLHEPGEDLVRLDSEAVELHARAAGDRCAAYCPANEWVLGQRA
jgi:hypothetical protein